MPERPTNTPEPGPASAPPTRGKRGLDRWRPPGPAALGLGGLGLLAAGGLLLRFGLDPLLQRLYDHWRPRLEQIVGKAMGHPLQLGPYRGFGPTGLRVGQSRFLAGPQDRSTIVVQELRALPLPLASWRDRSLVLELDLRDAEVDLRRNAYGQVWLLGRQAPGGAPPRLELRFRLPTSARLRLWGVSPQARPLAVEGRGGAVLRLHDRSLTFQVGLATPPGRPSTVVRGQGNWQRNLWQFDLAARRQPIQGLEPLLPLAGPLRGEVEGRFSLRIDRGDPSCQGDLTLANLTWQPRGLARPLASGRLPLQCRNQSLTLLRSPWRFGTWTGQVGGHTGLDGNLRLQLQAQAPAGNPLAGRPLAGSLQGHWIRGGVQAERLEARLGPSRLLAAGRLTSRADLHGGWWLDPGDLPQARRLPPWLLRPLQGQFEATGRWTSPRLALRTVQSGLPLIGTGAVDLVWSDGLLRLRNLSSSHLLASGQMPLALVNGRGMVAGPLQSRIQLRQFPLSRLNGLVATPLQGRLDLEGSLSGSLPRLLPTLRLRLHQPGAGPLRLRETWSGALVGSADAPLLWLTAPAPGTRLQVRFDRRWRPRDLRLERGGGALALSGSAQRYRWQARAFPLQGLALALGGDRRLHSLQGLLRGQGDLGLGPVSFRGDLAIDQPSLLRVSGQSLRARLAYDQRRYQLRGRWEAAGAASLEAQVQGGAGRELLARLQARAIGPALVRQLLSARDLWLGRPLPPHGRAADLGSLAIDTLGRSLEDQLALLAESRRLAAERDLALQQAPRAERLERLQYAVDADLVLRGPDTGRLKAELVGQGHLWMASADRDRGLTGDPFQFQLRGPLSRGEGQFDLSGLPLALLSLLTPVPDGLRGNLAAHGRYRLGSGRPQLDLDLALDRAGFGSQAFALERGRVKLLGESLGLDFSLRAAGAFSSVDLAGTLPLDPSSSALELRLSSREDGLHFLSRLGGEAVAWKRGSADLQLLVRGSLRDPIANGFLRLRQGECRFIGQTLKGVEATVLFDSQQLVLQNLVARVGRQGQIRGQGKLGLVRPLPSDTGLAIDLRAVPFTVPRLSAQAEGRLILAGSLLEPRLGGDVALGRGTLDVNPAPVAPAKAGSAQVAAPPTTAATSVPELVEAKWDFRSPLVLLGPDGSPSTAASLEQAIPRVSWLQFDGLRIGFGPELRVVVANVANFSTGGSLRLSGRLDSSLRATGLVRLLGGRLNLFTTSFNLDPDAPNVAIFTPSLGLVPYLDIALRTRIADSLNVTAPSAVGGADRSTLALTELQAQGGFSSLNQLNLILVTVSVSGPADRLAQNLRLRSSPPLPKERLVALIGGNTLAGLSGGGAGTALAAVLGQSLLSPLITSLSDALGQRVSLALYPTYVSPGIDSTQERRSGRVPPQLVLGSEVGYDLTDRINASVLMAPNRSDIPPQITVNYKASEKLNLETSVDTQGAWQTQLRFFLRF